MEHLWLAFSKGNKNLSLNLDPFLEGFQKKFLCHLPIPCQLCGLHVLKSFINNIYNSSEIFQCDFLPIKETLLNILEEFNCLRTRQSSVSSSMSDVSIVVDTDLEEFNQDYDMSDPVLVAVFTYWTTNRMGWKAEIENIENLCKTINCDTPIVHQDESLSKSKDSLQKISKILNKGRYSCLLLFVMGHGGSKSNDGRQYVKNDEDEFIPIDIFFDRFENKKIPKFAGKPRLIFVQSCRGEGRNEAVNTHADAIPYSRVGNRYPNIADFFLLMSSVEDVYSYRNAKEGGYFITEICQAIINYSDQPLESIVKYVNRRMLKLKGGGDSYCQISAIAHGTLTKNLTFCKKNI